MENKKEYELKQTIDISNDVDLKKSNNDHRYIRCILI